MPHLCASRDCHLLAYRHMRGGDSIISRYRSAVQAAGSCNFGDEAVDFKLPIILRMQLKAVFQSTF